MRFIPVFTLLLLLTACGSMTDTPTVVDASHLAPLSGREQSLLLAAESAVRQGKLEMAENDYLSAVGASTGHVEAHVALAQLYTRSNQPDKAQEILARALTLQPNNAGVNYLVGKAALAQNNPTAALAAFTNGLTTAPQDLDLTNGAAIAEDMLGKHTAAQARYSAAIAHNKGQPLTALRTNLALSYLLSGDAKRALPLLKTEAKTPNASPVIRHNLALAYGLLGDTANAKKSLGSNGDDATRTATLARLKSYLADKSPTKTPPSLIPDTAAP